MSCRTATSCIFVLAFSLLAAPAGAADRVPQDLEGGWKLVWHDEFDGPEVDSSKWRIEDAALKKNNEAQYYTPENAFINGGHLVLLSEKKRKGDRPYRSGLVETLGTFEFTYGRVEIRAQLPGGQGIWPAHWMLPADGSWPPEIDIVEMLGHDPKRIYMTNHWGSDWRSHRQSGESYRGPDFTKAEHVFVLEWEPDRMRWFVDGTLQHATTLHIPDVPMRLILNTAVGGDWPGYPNKHTKFPQLHRIDYVRIYQKPAPEPESPPGQA